MSTLVTIAQFRAWSGAATSTVPDSLIQQVLNEAEAGITVDIDSPIGEVLGNPAAHALASGEELRRASRLLARRNSPEGVAGMGDLGFTVPVRDPDSFRTVSAIRTLLGISEVVA